MARVGSNPGGGGTAIRARLREGGLGILVDECISPGVARELRHAGAPEIRILHVHDCNLGGEGDSALAAYCMANGLILLTKDRAIVRRRIQAVEFRTLGVSLITVSIEGSPETVLAFYRSHAQWLLALAADDGLFAYHLSRSGRRPLQF